MSIAIHLTNINGIGAKQLINSLLPAIENECPINSLKLYSPSHGDIFNYISKNKKIEIEIEVYRRYLPNSLSRFLECIFLAKRFAVSEHLLVLGDLPLRCWTKQTVFVQTAYMLKPLKFKFKLSSLKFLVLRLIFQLNARFASNFIVQTEYMKDEMIRSYPSLAGKIYVISQPVPYWLQSSRLKRYGRKVEKGCSLSLIYPAVSYEHKNHKLLENVDFVDYHTWPIRQLILTVDKKIGVASKIPWVTCVGTLSPENIVKSYSYVDGLLFLSESESYGFPLIEAMYVGLPIVCADFPYARNLCGDQAIYFDSNDISSLKKATEHLRKKIDDGWWPNWSSQLKNLPESWDDVAREFFRVMGLGHNAK
jgi:glycosyltransferase involved in cell wall biosynthesis